MVFNYYFYKRKYPVKRKLDRVTLVGVDCVDPQRLLACMELCQAFIDFGDVKLLSSIPVDAPYWESIPVLDSTQAYSKFITKELTHHIKTDFALVVQYDGFILNPSAWSDEFLNYDYVGASWWFQEGNNVGNGGFSLRSKALMDLMSQDKEVENYHPEDVVFFKERFHHLVNQGIKFAPYHLSRLFSMEGRLESHDAWKDSFGFHGFNVTDIRRWNYAKFVKPSQLWYWATLKRKARKIFLAAQKG